MRRRELVEQSPSIFVAASTVLPKRLLKHRANPRNALWITRAIGVAGGRAEVWSEGRSECRSHLSAPRPELSYNLCHAHRACLWGGGRHTRASRSTRSPPRACATAIQTGSAPRPSALYQSPRAAKNVAMAATGRRGMPAPQSGPRFKGARSAGGPASFSRRPSSARLSTATTDALTSCRNLEHAWPERHTLRMISGAQGLDALGPSRRGSPVSERMSGARAIRNVVTS